MPLSDHIKPPKKKMLDLNSLRETLIQSKYDGIFIIFRNNLNEFWDFDHGTNLGRVHPGPGLWIKRPGLSPGPTISDPTKGWV